ERPFNLNEENVVFFGSVLVIGSPSEHVIQGLDWRTGKRLWSTPNLAGDHYQLTGMYGQGDVGQDGFTAGGFGPNLTDHRLLQVGTDGTLRVYDAQTGQLRSTRPGVGATTDEYVAYEGTLYSVSRNNEPYRVRALDLDHPGDSRLVYAAPDADHRVE